MQNKQILIDSLPQGKLTAKNFRCEESEVPAIGEDEVLIKTTALIISAGTRAGLQGSASYAGAPEAGRVMNGTGVGEVVKSNCDTLPAGSLVTASTGWQQYSVHQGRAVEVIPADHDPLRYLGALGISGLTAYFGLLEVAAPKPGETVLVSAAAGSVGHLVGQLASIHGARAVGVCGSDIKAKALVEKLGFEAAVNYKSEDFREALKDATPDGVDVYFDNTGGMILGSALFRMNKGGRIACCGVVSQYDTDKPEPSPKGIPGLLINKRLNMNGFLVFDYAERYAEARHQLLTWLESGELQFLTDEVYGLEAAPQAFVDLLSGGNLGSRVVRLN